MIVQADVLSREEVLAIRQGLAAAPFRDGQVTAGAAAGNVKNNEQARGNDPGVVALARRVRLALEAHPWGTWARPVRWSTLMFARYGLGARYELHTDNAVMFDEGGWPVRSDISFTKFLSDLDSYEGGALVVRGPADDREFRPDAGSTIFYPTGQLHSVTPVTRGERLVCVSWLQSLIRRADQRELPFELEQVRAGMSSGGDSLMLDKAIGILLRMWVEG